MGVTRIFMEFAAAAANLHPDHRQRYAELVRIEPRRVARATGPDAAQRGGQSALTTVKSSSSSTSTSSPPASAISTS